MVRFIDDHRADHGVEPICAVLPIAPSVYYEAKAREQDPERLPERAKRDAVLKPIIQRLWDQNEQVYGAKKVWKQLKREKQPTDKSVARCTVARLMADLGLYGAIRGKKFVKTTTPDEVSPRPMDLVSRNFRASRPNQLWLSDLTYVPTRSGYRFVAFVIDAYADRIVGWRAGSSLRTDLALDALEQAIYQRQCSDGELVHHSDRGIQYLSIRYTERLAEAGIAPSVGSVGDSYDNALAESVIGLYKTELINRKGPWTCLEDLEFATLRWVEWFNNRRLLERIGYVPPAEFEAAYYAKHEAPAELAGVN